MAWYLNSYECERCSTEWEDEWSCEVDDECPACGAGDHCPSESIDLSEIIVECVAEFIVLQSPDSAEHAPDYIEFGKFATRPLAEDFARKLQKSRTEESDGPSFPVPKERKSC